MVNFVQDQQWSPNPQSRSQIAQDEGQQVPQQGPHHAGQEEPHQDQQPCEQCQQVLVWGGLLLIGEEAGGEEGEAGGTGHGVLEGPEKGTVGGQTSA